MEAPRNYSLHSALWTYALGCLCIGAGNPSQETGHAPINNCEGKMKPKLISIAFDKDNDIFALDEEGNLYYRQYSSTKGESRWVKLDPTIFEELTT